MREQCGSLVLSSLLVLYGGVEVVRPADGPLDGMPRQGCPDVLAIRTAKKLDQRIYCILVREWTAPPCVFQTFETQPLPALSAVYSSYLAV